MGGVSAYPNARRMSWRFPMLIMCAMVVVELRSIPGICIAIGAWILAVEAPAAIDRRYPRQKISRAYIWAYARHIIGVLCAVLMLLGPAAVCLAMAGLVFGILIPDALVRRRECLEAAAQEALYTSTGLLQRQGLAAPAPDAESGLVKYTNKPKALIVLDRWMFDIWSLFCVVLFIGMAVLSLYFGCYLGYGQLSASELARQELSWPATEAVITSNRVVAQTSRQEPTQWSAQWMYSYSVNGQVYQASTTAAAQRPVEWFGTRDAALQEAARRPPGYRLPSYYDPAAPQRAVLDKRPVRTTNALIVVLVGFAAAFGVFCGGATFWVAKQNLRHRARMHALYE